MTAVISIRRSPRCEASGETSTKAWPARLVPSTASVTFSEPATKLNETRTFWTGCDGSEWALTTITISSRLGGLWGGADQAAGAPRHNTAARIWSFGKPDPFTDGQTEHFSREVVT